VSVCPPVYIFALQEDPPLISMFAFFSGSGATEPYSFVSTEQLVLHVLAYAEVLFRWKLLHKRIELLKAVDPFLRLSDDSSLDFDHSQLGTCLFTHSLFLCTYDCRRGRCIHSVHSVRSADRFSHSIGLFCLWHPSRNAPMLRMPPSRQRHVCDRLFASSRPL